MFNTYIDNDPDPHQRGASPALKPTPETFHVVTLNRNDIPAFISLQNLVRSMLDDDKKHHLKERTRMDLHRHFDADMPLVGVKTNTGKLVGQVLMAFADNKATKNVEAYPLEGVEKVTMIVQSLAIHPAYEGRGLSYKLHDKALELAKGHDCTLLMAKVADDNPKSQKSFLNNHFTVAAKGHDPVKGYPATYYVRPVENGCSAASQDMALNA